MPDSKKLGRPSLPLSVRAVALAAGALAALLVPRVTAQILEREGEPLFEGDPAAERAAALGAASWNATRAEDFATGAELYDREWAFGAPMMRLACLSQVSLRNVQLAAELAVPIRKATEDVLSDEARRFTAMKWGSDPIASDDRDHDHAAYLGYAGIALGLARATGEPAAARGHEIVIARLRSRAAAAQGSWLRTYPDEIYPPDVAATIGALAMGAVAIGAVAVGALAIGALAVRRLAIGRVQIEGARVKSLEIEDLTVRRLRAVEVEAADTRRLPQTKVGEEIAPES